MNRISLTYKRAAAVQRFCRTACLLALGGLGLFPTASQAQLPDGVENMIVFKGHCKRFVVGKKSHHCDAVIYSQFQNGRVGFNVLTKTGAIMLSGGQDSQLDSGQYTLLIDTVRFSDGQINNQYNANGNCEMSFSPDGVYVQRFKCRASNGVEKITLDFVGGKTPVERMQ